MRRLVVIGAGKVGRTLARLWHDAGVFAVGDVVCRGAASAAAAVAFIGAGRPATRVGRLADGDALLIAVPDDRIAALADELATDPRGGLNGTLAWHCSGAMPATVLAPLAARGARIAAAHPVHSFADPRRSLVRLAGSWCALDGDRAALDALAPAYAALGVRTVEVDSTTKPLYHAGGVLACNYLVALVDRAAALLEASGIARADALPLLEPLVRATVDNLFDTGPERALTGPIARGDAGMVARQLAAVSAADAEDGRLYRALGRAALALAARRGTLDERQLAALRTTLEEPR